MDQDTKIELLENELSYLNQLLIECGFTEGVKTLKEAAEELIEENSNK